MSRYIAPEWRTRSLPKRRFYAKYMGWLERVGYLVVLSVFAAFIFAFNYPVDDLVRAENVPIEPRAHPVRHQDEVLIVRLLVEEFSEVEAGQPVVEVAVGAEAIEAYRRWEAGQVLGQTLAAPALTQLSAPVAGMLRSLDPKMVEAGEPIVEVLDFSDIRLRAKLSGDTVAKARKGQTARLDAINLNTEAPAIFRARTNTGDVIGRSVLNGEINDALAGELSKNAVQLRNDLALQVTGVESVEVDAHATWQPADAAPSTRLDPVRDRALTATVVEGSHTATIQVADLPPDARRKAEDIVRRGVEAGVYRTPDDQTGRLSDVEDIRFVLKVRTEEVAAEGSEPLPGTKLDRHFEAELRVDSPPDYLVEALRASARSGAQVTARVQLKTGTRPIALILLRRS